MRKMWAFCSLEISRLLSHADLRTIELSEHVIKSRAYYVIKSRAYYVIKSRAYHVIKSRAYYVIKSRAYY